MSATSFQPPEINNPNFFKKRYLFLILFTFLIDLYPLISEKLAKFKPSIQSLEGWKEDKRLYHLFKPYFTPLFCLAPVIIISCNY